jgi:hypothetical protein
MGLYNTDGIYLEGNVINTISWHFPEDTKESHKIYQHSRCFGRIFKR